MTGTAVNEGTTKRAEVDRRVKRRLHRVQRTRWVVRRFRGTTLPSIRAAVSVPPPLTVLQRLLMRTKGMLHSAATHVDPQQPHSTSRYEHPHGTPQRLDWPGRP